MPVDLAELQRKRDLLVGCDVLVVEEQDLPVHPGIVEQFDEFLVEVAEPNAIDISAEVGCVGPDSEPPIVGAHRAAPFGVRSCACTITQPAGRVAEVPSVTDLSFDDGFSLTFGAFDAPSVCDRRHDRGFRS